jgi:hypothetical protein
VAGKFPNLSAGRIRPRDFWTGRRTPRQQGRLRIRRDPRQLWRTLLGAEYGALKARWPASFEAHGSGLGRPSFGNHRIGDSAMPWLKRVLPPLPNTNGRLGTPTDDILGENSIKSRLAAARGQRAQANDDRYSRNDGEHPSGSRRLISPRSTLMSCGRQSIRLCCRNSPT